MSENDVWTRIAAPLVKGQIKTRQVFNKKSNTATNIRYISRDSVIYRLNQVCPGDWHFEVEMISTPGTGGSWVAKGRLTICGVVREDFGVPENADMFDPPKAAASDALKRCASQFGFALELYGDEPEAPGEIPSAPTQYTAEDYRHAFETKVVGKGNTGAPTSKQTQYLAMLMSQAFADSATKEKDRYAVMSYLIGRTVTSTKSLMQHEVTTLLDWLADKEGNLSEKGRQGLELCLAEAYREQGQIEMDLDSDLTEQEPQ